MRSWYHSAFVVGLLAAGLGSAEAQDATKPNIVVIMGDDIGWSNIGVYNQGIMSGRTPHLDQLANDGMRFTDYYAEASCTAGRANFITGELPIRTGMTTVGQAGSPIGIPAEAITIATALKAQGYRRRNARTRTRTSCSRRASRPCRPACPCARMDRGAD